MSRANDHADIPRNIFQHYDPFYERIGLSTTPVEPRGKGPPIAGWTKHSGLGAEQRARLRNKYPNARIGLLAGPTLPNGNVTGLLDCDHSGFNEFLRRAVNPVSGKIGRQGITPFCQFESGTKSKKVRQKVGSKPILEIMSSSGGVAGYNIDPGSDAHTRASQ